MRITRCKKLIAVFFLFVFTAQLLIPNVSYALTSGPSQPEMAKFEPAGTSDLVDLFSGDMKYNIPLMDVGGYPVNISYQSGTGMEDEAGWVGTGWTLNPGVMNRNMRGLPDDFDGSKGDKIDKEYSKKEFKKVGGQLVIKPSLLGWETGPVGSLKLNVYKDNYYGIGASVGASIGFTLAKNQAGTLTAGLDIGVNSDTRNGVDINPSFSLKRSYDFMEDESTKWSLSAGFSYNTRGGLKSLSLDASYNTARYANNLPPNIERSAVKYFGQSHNPQINTNTKNTGFTFSFDLGPSIFGVYAGLGGSGYVYKQFNVEPTLSVPAFGYLNYAKGRKDEGALLDFNREKDGVFLTTSPAIPVPVATNDFFVAANQAGSQQFRPYFGGNYVVFDRIHSNINNNTSLGLTVGGINLFKAGGRLDLTEGNETAKKWTKNNTYLIPAETPVNTTSDSEPVYFKQVGEHTVSDNLFFEKFGNAKTAKPTIITNAGGAGTNTILKTRTGNVALQDLKKNAREKRNYGFSYLTTAQAMKYALDTKIGGLDRNGETYRKPHHISDITVTDNEGKRMVYGIPVYNTYQEEATFAIQQPASSLLEKARRTGIISYTASDASPLNRNGRDWLYTKDKTPGYATSYLLTGILSPDYVDRKNDGITDDDLGTAVRFNYTRHTKEYKWRAPYQQNKANYNEGAVSDKKDDKGNYAYGEKEIWYLQNIESKTMVAIFELSNREDGLGVSGPTGGKNDQLKLKKLDKIKLYSRADWIRNGTNATPIKVVNFEYDYSLYKDVINNSGMPIDKNGVVLTLPQDINDPAKNVNLNKGKLTLKKIYFTFGKSSRGISNPYEFDYDLRPINNTTITNLPAIDPADDEFNDVYLERQNDRWGTYKKSFYNRVANGQRTINNSEFPYSLQEKDDAITAYSERELADRFASKWQLNKIITPSSGIITIDYESDDYAYVQNRKAMQMCFVKGINTEGQSTGFINKGKIGVKKLVVELPKAVTGLEEFKRLYLTEPDGRLADKLFYKINTDLNAQGKYEYVHGYAQINWDAGATTISPDGRTAFIAINKNNEYNPIVKAAWQMLRTDLPQFAYDGYDNSDAENFADDAIAAIKSIVIAIGNLNEIVKPFEKRAEARNFADRIDLTRAMVRLNSPDSKKIGGGCRVKKVQITDEWKAMNNDGSQFKTAKYGQVYDYTEKDNAGNFISSGVASYEPQIGNEENPFHEPINFTEKVHWSSDRHHFMEKPFCETYFPAASVGYSKVTITSFGDDYTGGVLTKHTGYIENEFYTAKDFPTIVDYLTLDQLNYENSLIIKLFSSESVKKVSTSQGFKVELNDMHGKPKAVRVYNKGGDLISSSEYFYRVKDQNAQVKELDNDNVPILEHVPQSANGVITHGTVATDIDFVTDVRESINTSTGTSYGAYVGSMIIPAFFIPIVIPYAAVNRNKSKTIENYNSISAVKVINRFGIVSKVVTTQNGSTIEAENLLWDALTGEVLLTRTQNEFDKSTYAFSYPAYMVGDYEGMSGAYRNIGAVFSNFQTGTNGDVSAYNTYLFPGDELIALNIDKRGWIIKSSGNTLRLVDEKGEFLSASGPWQILRSGRRNLLTASVGSIISMKDPRVGDQLVLDVDKRVLDSKSIEFKEEWGVPVNNTYTLSTVTGRWVCDIDYWKAFTESLFEINPATGKRYFFSFIENNVTVGDIIRVGIQKGYFDPQSTPLVDFFYACTPGIAPNVDQTYYYLKYKREITPPGGYYSIYTGDYAYFATAEGEKIDSIWFPVFNLAAEHFLNDESIQPNDVSWGGSACDKNARYRVPASSPSNSYCAASRVAGNSSQLLKPENVSDTIYYNNNAAKTQSTQAVCEFRLDIRGLVPNDGSGSFCADPLNKKINPYYQGVLGNWRPEMNYAFTVAREQKPGNILQVGGTDIRNSGYYTVYAPFWNWQSGALARTFAGNQTIPLSDPRSRWVWSNKSVYYDQKGNEIESVDALNRYGTALFGYKQSVATAVGANARNNEIAFESYEDYDFDLELTSSEPCPQKRHLDFGFSKQGSIWTTSGGSISTEQSHTGKYSYKLNGTTSITKPAGNAVASASSILSYDGAGRYVLNSNELANGFAPVNGKQYLFSCWVYDGSPSTNTLNGVTITVNGVSATTVTVVEGWKRVEIPFTGSPAFNLVITGSGSRYIDDLRIFPNDGQMNSYVYDDKTMRLMAQLDENNFATLYEYDDEGTPVRVKKETERGIMTLKESRQSLRKRN